jgi:hypothetical protein
MANLNAPRGLIPYRSSTDGYTTGGMGLYYVPATYGPAIFVGDPVVPTGASDANGIPVVNLATAGATNVILGPMVSIAAGGRSGNYSIPVTRDMVPYRAASTAQYILVDHNPNALFWVQEDSLPLSAGFIPVATAGMKNGNLIAGTGSTVTGYSGWTLDSSTVVTAGPTLQLRILRALQEEDNEPGANYAKWLVRINLHALTGLNGF